MSKTQIWNFPCLTSCFVMARLGLNWYGDLLVLLKNFFGIGDVGRTTHAFSAIRAEKEHHLLELGWFVRYYAIDVAQFSWWEIGWLGIFHDSNPEESADSNAGDPQNCHADQRYSGDDAPARPFLVHGSSLLRNPCRIVRTVLHEIHDWSEQNRQHREWADVFPAQHPDKRNGLSATKLKGVVDDSPVNVRPTTSHQFDIISEPPQTVYIADSNALKAINKFRWESFPKLDLKNFGR